MTQSLCEIWAQVSKPVIGMLHLPPLPGSPRYGGDMAEVRSFVLRDAQALIRGGVHGLMLENFGDVPFFTNQVPAHTACHMTALALAVSQLSDLPFGINVLRNDATSALAVAHAAGAAFIRVNILSGAAVTDQGIIEAQAAQVMRYRKTIGAQGIKVFADVAVKHATTLGSLPLDQQVHDLTQRALADGIIVSGSSTGRAIDVGELQEVKQAAGSTPVIVGSGATVQSLEQLAKLSNGFIVGTHFKRAAQVNRPIDIKRVKAFMQRLSQL